MFRELAPLLVNAVGGNAAVEVLPENVLARTQQMLAWRDAFRGRQHWLSSGR